MIPPAMKMTPTMIGPMRPFHRLPELPLPRPTSLQSSHSAIQQAWLITSLDAFDTSGPMLHYGVRAFASIHLSCPDPWNFAFEPVPCHRFGSGRHIPVGSESMEDPQIRGGDVLRGITQLTSFALVSILSTACGATSPGNPTSPTDIRSASTSTTCPSLPHGPFCQHDVRHLR
jgi:hypothetical protein